MTLAHPPLSEFGLCVQQSPDLTEIRLPARLRFSTLVALAFVGSITILFWLGFTAAAIHTRSSAALGLWIIATIAALAIVYGLSRVVSCHRHGVTVSATPDRLVVQPHWATLEAPLTVYLKRACLEETRRAIVISGGGRKLKVATALRPEARLAVVEFLKDVIAGYLHEPAPPGQDARSPETVLAPAGASPSDSETPCGSPRAHEEPDSDPFEIRVLAICQRLQAFDLDDVHLAPTIPQEVFVAAAQSYLDIKEDEALLAIVGVKQKGPAIVGCALTTKRIYWPGKIRGAALGGPTRCQSLEFASLPATIKAIGYGAGIDLGQRRSFALHRNVPLRDALIQLLTALRAMARGDTQGWQIPDRDRANARLRWPGVTAANAEARALQAEIRTFETRTMVASRPVVTPAIVLACVSVFVAMIARGVSAMTPTSSHLILWGANFGPSVVFDGETWRLFTAMFVHIGFVHLAVNMFCLVTAGPVVERFFGHVGFALLYLIAGFGGSIASLWAHPTYVGAGASGAIFGIFGGLLGFLAIRHREVPPALLKPMRAGAITFVGYNTLFGLMAPAIDTAAHLGGLATGFVCGLLMTLGSTVSTGHARRLAPAIFRLAAAGAVTGVLAVIAPRVIDIARARILADPEVGPLVTAQYHFAPAFNAFYRTANPVLEELTEVADGIDQLGADLERDRVPKTKFTQTLDRLKARCIALKERIAAINAEGPELKAIRQAIDSAQSHQIKMLDAIDRFVITGEESHLRGPDGFQPAATAYVDDLNRTVSLREAYIRAHHLQVSGEKPRR
jgi:rhomboid protease GluP